MENCIDLTKYNGRDWVIIKQPGSVRHSTQGTAITKLEMTIEQALELAEQIQEKCGKK